MSKQNRPGRNKPYSFWMRFLVNDQQWSFEELAAEFGASFSSVKNWYYGHTLPIRSYREQIYKLYKKERSREKTT